MQTRGFSTCLILIFITCSTYAQTGKSKKKKLTAQLENVDSLYRLFGKNRLDIGFSIFDLQKNKSTLSISNVDVDLDLTKDTAEIRSICNKQNLDYSIYFPLITSMHSAGFNTIMCFESTDCPDSLIVIITSVKECWILDDLYTYYYLFDTPTGNFDLNPCGYYLEPGLAKLTNRFYFAKRRRGKILMKN